MDPLSDILNDFSKVLRGKNDLLEKVLAAYLAGGHILLEDLPGTGKTTVGRTLAKLVEGAQFKRIQFTPDLLPYDITGVDVWDERKREFVFHPGPVFAHVVLADEIGDRNPESGGNRGYLSPAGSPERPLHVSAQTWLSRP